MIADQSIYNQIVSFIDYILDHQLADGWIGPTFSLPDGYRDPWPRMPVLFTLQYYHEIVNGGRSSYHSRYVSLYGIFTQTIIDRS